jgi:nucleoid DNA-binding protein
MSTDTPTTSRLNTRLLGEAVAADLGVSKAEGARMVHAVLDTIARAVTGGHTVAVTNFGTWTPTARPARTAHNPQTGEPVPVPARQEVRFRPSDRLRELVASQDSATATIRKHPKTARS